MIDLLFKCLDALRRLCWKILKSTSDEGTEDNEAIIKELNDFIAKTESAEETGITAELLKQRKQHLNAGRR